MFDRAEVEAAFAHFYQLGCVDEDWTGWADLFTDDCTYVEHFWGTMRGRDEVRTWIHKLDEFWVDRLDRLGRHLEENP